MYLQCFHPSFSPAISFWIPPSSQIHDFFFLIIIITHTYMYTHTYKNNLLSQFSNAYMCTCRADYLRLDNLSGS